MLYVQHDLASVSTGGGAVCRSDYNVPDRLLALSSVRELSQRRKWNLILVNVEPVEAERLREEHFRHLVHPLRTVLDDSIGCALWFAARGEGLLQSMGPGEGKGGANGLVPCVSSAKVSQIMHQPHTPHVHTTHAHTHTAHTHATQSVPPSSLTRHCWWALVQMNSLPATPDTDRGSSTVVGKDLLKRWIWMSNEYHHATLAEMTGG